MKDPTKAYLAEQAEALANFDYATASDEEKAKVRDLLKFKHDREMEQAQAEGPPPKVMVYEGDGIMYGFLLTLEPHGGCAGLTGEFHQLPIEGRVALLTQWINMFGHIRADLEMTQAPDPGKPAA